MRTSALRITPLETAMHLPLHPQRAYTILREAQQCDPNTWTSTQTQGSNHVTAGKHPPGARERLQGLLLAQPEVRRHLCLLTEVFGYEEPRCGAVAARRAHRRRL